MDFMTSSRKTNKQKQSREMQECVSTQRTGQRGNPSGMGSAKPGSLARLVSPSSGYRSVWSTQCPAMDRQTWYYCSSGHSYSHRKQKTQKLRVEGPRDSPQCVPHLEDKKACTVMVFRDGDSLPTPHGRPCSEQS